MILYLLMILQTTYNLSFIFRYIRSNIEHSCRPNADRLFKGNMLGIRAVKAIAQDEKVHLTLVPQYYPREQVRQLLMDNQLIDCKCEECSKEPEQDVRSQVDWDELRKIHDGMDKLKETKNWTEIGDTFEKLVSVGQKIYGEYFSCITLQMLLMVFSRLNAARLNPENFNKMGTFRREERRMVAKLVRAMIVTHGEDHPLYQLFVAHMIKEFQWPEDDLNQMRIDAQMYHKTQKSLAQMLLDLENELES